MSEPKQEEPKKREEMSRERIIELQKHVPFQHMRRKGDVLPSMKIGKYYMPIFFNLFMDKIEHFPVDEGDVWVCTFPKSGTTWMQQIVYLLKTKDFEGGRTIPIDVRVPEIEIPTPYPPKPENIDEIGKRPSPRLIKSHMAYCMLPKNINKAKVIYVYRNPRDMLVSFYHFYRAWTASYYEGTFEELVDLFVNERISYGPWPDHLQDFYEVSKQPNSNVLMVSYEDLKKDRRGGVKRIAEFLGLERTDAEIDEVVEASSFEAMKNNDAANYNWLSGEWLDPGREPFVRKGIIGDWKNHFNEESIKKLDEYMQRRMKDSGIPIHYS